MRCYEYYKDTNKSPEPSMKLKEALRERFCDVSQEQFEEAFCTVWASRPIYKLRILNILAEDLDDIEEAVQSLVPRLQVAFEEMEEEGELDPLTSIEDIKLSLKKHRKL
mmetsp:Transcript_34696/g.61025  ORF Transcript_34696/g.61025 Transcript_34696/m.61025 type:complete len:109 (+) Transcript_34696:2145-2471(+)